MNLANPNLSKDDDFILYHLGLSRNDFPDCFSDVKFVCMGGTASRMKNFTRYLQRELNLPISDDPKDFSAASDRYSLFKCGPVLNVSHGIGFSSISVVINEVLKLLYYSHCTDVTFFRIGTCGGIGVDPGTVILSKSCVNGLMQNVFEMPVLGRLVSRDTSLNQDLHDDLLNCRSIDDDFPLVSGTTMSCPDFYECQARTDGAICEYGLKEKMIFLKDLRDKGVVNFEMEATVLSSMCNMVGVKASILCVCLIDRLQEDQVKFIDPSEKIKWELRPQKLVTRYIKSKLCGYGDK